MSEMFDLLDSVKNNRCTSDNWLWNDATEKLDCTKHGRNVELHYDYNGNEFFSCPDKDGLKFYNQNKEVFFCHDGYQYPASY